MSIHLVLFAVSEPDLARITAEPTLVHHLFDCEPGSRAAADLPREQFDVADAWGVIDFALTGGDDVFDAPIGFLLAWGTPIGDVDAGYGPARALTVRQARDVNDVLAAIPAADFARRLDVATFQLAGVYHADAFHGHEQALVELYADLRAFVAGSALAGRALIVALT